MDKLRLRFRKTGRAVYISHLDLMQTLQRGFSRAGYELKYSEGFNPHPQISVALPMSLGVESQCELLDFRLKSDTDPAALPERLSAALPEGIEIIECYEPQRKIAELKYLEVQGRFQYDGRRPEAMARSLEDFYAAPQIVITKRSKRGENETDIVPLIARISFEAQADAVSLRAVISAQDPSLNPELLADALRQKRPELAPDFTGFTRLETLDAGLAVYR